MEEKRKGEDISIMGLSVPSRHRPYSTACLMSVYNNFIICVGINVNKRAVKNSSSLAVFINSQFSVIEKLSF